MTDAPLSPQHNILELKSIEEACIWLPLAQIDMDVLLNKPSPDGVQLLPRNQLFQRETLTMLWDEQHVPLNHSQSLQNLITQWGSHRFPQNQSPGLWSPITHSGNQWIRWNQLLYPWSSNIQRQWVHPLLLNIPRLNVKDPNILVPLSLTGGRKWSWNALSHQWLQESRLTKPSGQATCVNIPVNHVTSQSEQDLYPSTQRGEGNLDHLANICCWTPCTSPVVSVCTFNTVKESY